MQLVFCFYQVGSDTCMLRLTYTHVCIAITKTGACSTMKSPAERQRRSVGWPRYMHHQNCGGNKKKREHRRAVHVQRGKLRIGQRRHAPYMSSRFTKAHTKKKQHATRQQKMNTTMHNIVRVWIYSTCTFGAIRYVIHDTVTEGDILSLCMSAIGIYHS